MRRNAPGVFDTAMMTMLETDGHFGQRGERKRVHREERNVEKEQNKSRAPSFLPCCHPGWKPSVSGRSANNTRGSNAASRVALSPCVRVGILFPDDRENDATIGPHHEQLNAQTTETHACPAVCLGPERRSETGVSQSSHSPSCTTARVTHPAATSFVDTSQRTAKRCIERRRMLCCLRGCWKPQFDWSVAVHFITA